MRHPEIRITGRADGPFELRGEAGAHRDLRSAREDRRQSYENARDWYPAAASGTGTGFPTVTEALPAHRFTQALAAAALRAAGLRPPHPTS